MKIINPTLEDLEVQKEGVKYFLPANGELGNVPEEVARWWQEKVHEFIILKKDTPVTEIKKEEKLVDPKMPKTLKETKPEPVHAVIAAEEKKEEDVTDKVEE